MFENVLFIIDVFVTFAAQLPLQFPHSIIVFVFVLSEHFRSKTTFALELLYLSTGFVPNDAVGLPVFIINVLFVFVQSLLLSESLQ